MFPQEKSISIPGKTTLAKRPCTMSYIVGDLTGIPLLKFAVEQTRKKVFKNNKRQIPSLQIRQSLNLKSKNDEHFYDVVIIGAGPAGIAAAIEAQKKKVSNISF